MTPRERYDLQIAATVFGIVGCILLWWALWSGAWSKTKTTDLNTKNLSLQLFMSRGLFSRCTTVNHVELLGKTSDDAACCSHYIAKDFSDHASFARIGALQSTGLWSGISAGIAAVLLFVTMCHMKAKTRQDVRWAGLAFGFAAFVLSTITVSMYAQWTKDVAKKNPSQFPKASADAGTGIYAAGTFYVGLAAILIGISTHNASVVATTTTTPLTESSAF